VVLSRVPTRLRRLCRILREKIFDLLRTLRGILTGFFVSFRTFLIRNYYQLHVFALLYATIGVPIQITVFPSFPSIFHQSLAIIAIVVPVFLASIFWRNVAQENPRIYLRTLRLKFWASTIFWILLFAFGLSLPFLWLSAFLKNTTLILYSLGAFALIVEILAGISMLEATLSGIDLPAIFSNRFRLELLRTNANAYFTAIVNGYNLERDISYFKSGMGCVNNYLKVKFKLGLLKQQDYSNFFKMIALSRNEEEKHRLREALNDFAHKLNSEMDLTDTLVATNNIVGKSILRSKDVVEELDFDVGIREALSKNRNLIVFIVSLIALCFSAYEIIAPYILNIINS
jgi:hypothetical protein